MSTVRSLCGLSLAPGFSGSGPRAAFHVDDQRWQVTVDAMQVAEDPQPQGTTDDGHRRT